MTPIDGKQILQEIMGTFVPNRPPNINPRNYPRPGEQDLRSKTYDIEHVGLKLSYCNQLEGWQRNIVDTLAGQMGGNALASDQYIIARPGGGKTLPIICYWTQHLLGLNTSALKNQNIEPGLVSLFSKDTANRTNTPRIIFLVPVIVLAHQTSMEVRKYISSLMIQAYENNPIYYINHFLVAYPQFRISTFRDNIASLNAQLERLNGLPYDNQERNIISRIHEALNSAKKNLKTAVEDCFAFIINEMVWTETAQSNQKTDFDRALVFVSIYESAPKLVERIKNLRLTIIDEAHLIQESGIEDDDNSRAYQIMGSLLLILKTLRKNANNRLVMLSGTINPKSAKNVTDYFNDCFGRNFSVPTSAPIEASNRSNLAIIPNESINTDTDILRYISRNVSQRDWGQLYILFSTPRIVQIAKECVAKLGIKNVESMSPAGYSPSNVFNGLGTTRQNENKYNINDKSIDITSIPKDMVLQVSNITNPLLRQCVLRGVGFISRKIPGESFDIKEANMSDNDKLIVAKLFKERKISVLLATDAVGIGVNIDVKDLYIPKIQKFSGAVGTQVNITLRDLSQILNRAGRGATPIASIQTPKDNIEMVSNALFANPEDLPDIEELRKRGVNPCDYKFIMTNWKKIFRRNKQ